LKKLLLTVVMVLVMVTPSAASGWYLLVPILKEKWVASPLEGWNQVPLKDWNRMGLFDTAAECETWMAQEQDSFQSPDGYQDYVELRKIYRHVPGPPPSQQDVIRDFNLGQCVSTDDPRLR
jgi:hypothetical protein